MKKAFVYFFITLVIVGFSAAILLAAEKPAAEGISANGGVTKGMIAIASGATIAAAALGGALGQGKAVSSAMEGIARNPGAQEKLFIPLILGLVFIESLVIYSLVIAFFLQAKI
ncbi:MAG TPA: ATP synthase F0 subunit C [Nitrospinota bacterium]|nr:ATP synthase F0 subunit C [Nitrospinota bacterium]